MPELSVTNYYTARKINTPLREANDLVVPSPVSGLS